MDELLDLQGKLAIFNMSSMSFINKSPEIRINAVGLYVVRTDALASVLFVNGGGVWALDQR